MKNSLFVVENLKVHSPYLNIYRKIVVYIHITKQNKKKENMNYRTFKKKKH